jgi:SAM-dependent methyltransferase
MAVPDLSGDDRRSPSSARSTWAVRAPLAAWLRAEAERVGQELGRARVLDVGSGIAPYRPFFEPHAESYVTVDADGTRADLAGRVEQLPVDDASFDVVLCTQVLEHCADPAQAVRELRRVTAPGGRVLASTHGVQVYHPAPDDLWRWTHTGLERLFAVNGDWSALTVRPGSGTTACLGMLVTTYMELLAGRAGLRRAVRPLVAAVNRGAEAVDRRSPTLRAPVPGTLFANYHVVAEVAR